MIWLAGIAVVFLAVVAATFIQISSRLGDILSALNGLSSMRYIIESQSDLAQATLDTLKEIERHAAQSAAPDYDRQYEQDHYPWGRSKDL